MTTNQSDQRLAELIASRDESETSLREAHVACEQLYRRHANALLGYLTNRTSRCDVEDIHQAIWERVWRELPTKFRGGNVRAWIFSITRNYLIDLSRKKRADTIEGLEQHVDTSQMLPDRRMEEQERMASLRRCLEQLEETIGAIVRGRLAGHAYSRLCEQTGLQPAQAHKAFHSGKRQLQDCIRNTTE